MDNEFYFVERFDKSHAWVDLLLLATHKPRTVFIRGIEFHLKPGDLIEAQKTLAQRWRWSNKTVVRFLKTLEQRGQISTKVHHRISVISIANWQKYQVSDAIAEPQTTPQSTPATRRARKETSPSAVSPLPELNKETAPWLNG